MPCQEWFDEQDEDYRSSVLPAEITNRVSVEAGIAMGWTKYLGASGRSLSIEHYGESADGVETLKRYGYTPENVAELVKAGV